MKATIIKVPSRHIIVIEDGDDIMLKFGRSAFHARDVASAYGADAVEGDLECLNTMLSLPSELWPSPTSPTSQPPEGSKSEDGSSSPVPSSGPSTGQSLLTKFGKRSSKKKNKNE